MTERLFQRILAGTAVVLTLLLVQRLAMPAHPAEPEIEAAPEAPAAPATPSPPAPISFSALEARPLFTPDRRQPPKAPPPAPVAQAPTPPPPIHIEPPLPAPESMLVLLGIIDAPDGRIAVIRLKSTGETLRLVEGAKVDRWRLDRIASTRVTLVSGETAQELGFPAEADRTRARAQPGRTPVLAPATPFAPPFPVSGPRPVSGPITGQPR